MAPFTEPYQVPNRLHVIACSNTPPETDDPAVEVPPLAHRIPDDVLRRHLGQEAGDFLLTLFRLDLPEDDLPVPKGVAAHWRLLSSTLSRVEALD